MPIRGIKESKKNLKAYNNALLDGGADGATATVEIVKERAVQLAPERTGALKRSAFASLTPLKGRNTVLAYVGFEAPYAAEVHETHPTKAKFLELAWMEMRAITTRSFRLSEERAIRKAEGKFRFPRYKRWG